MKCHKTFGSLVSGVTLSMLLIAFTFIPTLAVDGDRLIILDPDEGKVGDTIEIDGYGFAAEQPIRFYFSSDKANEGDVIDEEVTTYKRIVSEAFTDTGGNFYAPISITIPSELTDGDDDEGVCGGDYYIYAVYPGIKYIKAVVSFTVLGPLLIDPDHGEIGDTIEIDGYSLKANEMINIIFSSDKAEVGDYIDKEVTNYEYLETAAINSDGEFDTLCYITIPNELTHGIEEKEVHGGNYYFYATYYLETKRIEAVVKFVVIVGKIELTPDNGQVGTEVEISGEGLRNSQELTIKYDSHTIDIANGDDETDIDGKFSSTIVIPESTAGSHVITVADESGNRPTAVFSVQPQIIIEPLSVAEGNVVKVSGTGFEKAEYITITVDNLEVLTTPESIHTNYLGSFEASFIIPSSIAHGDSDTVQVDASDSSLNTAEAQLTILAGSDNIDLSPPTSLTSPGHVGMELAANGIGFITNATVTITYGDGEDTTIATTMTDANGNFSVTFTVPPSFAGVHTVTATDGTTSKTSVFTMESDAPPMPASLLGETVIAKEDEAYFNWEDVEDISGVTYILQIAPDADFNKIVLEKGGLTKSEYITTAEEQLQLIEEKEPYHWRVKAVDGAANESKWTTGGVLYIGPSRTWATSGTLIIGICIGVGIIGLLICILSLRRQSK